MKETEEALADTSLLQLSPAPSLTLTSLQLQSVVESLSSNLCFLISMLVASIVKSDRFQLWSFQLTRAQLCRQKSSSTSLQQRALAAAYATDLSFQLQSLQQRELAAAYAFMAQECSTRASPDQLDAFQVFRSAFRTAGSATGSKAASETGFAAGAFQDPGSSFLQSSSSSLQYSIFSI